MDELKKAPCDNNIIDMQMLESRLASGEQDDSHRCGRAEKGEGGEEAETFFTSFASNFFKGFPSHRSGRPREINFISRYICFSQIGPFDVCFEELFSKVQNPGGFFRKIVF